MSSKIPQQDSAAPAIMPWQEFFDWLIEGIATLEPLNYKSIQTSARGWRQNMDRKLQRQIEHLKKMGVVLTGNPVAEQNNTHSIPPYLQQAKQVKNWKLFVACLVAAWPNNKSRYQCVRRALAKKGVKPLPEEAALKVRVCKFRSELNKSATLETFAVEVQFASFRFNIDSSDQPGQFGRVREPYGKKPLESLPPILPWNSNAGLSEWEKSEIAKLCANPLLASQSPSPQLRGPGDGRLRDPHSATPPQGDGERSPQGHGEKKNRSASRG